MFHLTLYCDSQQKEVIYYADTHEQDFTHQREQLDLKFRPKKMSQPFAMIY